MNQLVGSFSGPSTSSLFTPYALLLFMTEVRSFHCRSKGMGIDRVQQLLGLATTLYLGAKKRVVRAQKSKLCFSSFP